jgi:uncharacterized heparinase superfamily protein
MRSAVQFEASRHVSRLIDTAPVRLARLSTIGRTSALVVAAAWHWGAPVLRDYGSKTSATVAAVVLRTIELVEPAVDDIAIALKPLRPADADRALAMYAGTFTLAGKTVTTDGSSIFAIAAPSAAFARELHGFVWLSHLAKANTPLSRLHAQALVQDWMDLDDDKRTPALSLEASVTADRLSALLAYADWLRDGATEALRQQLLVQVTKDVRRLRRCARERGVAQIGIDAALVAACVAVPVYRRRLPRAMQRLDGELKRQVLADGGHVSRCPNAVAEMLEILMPLRAAMAEAGLPASTVMMNAIDRMLPMLRFFIDPTGRVAHFNGAAQLEAALVDALLAADDTGGHAHGNASHSGYQRLEAAGTVAILDCGAPPPPEFARYAHAGTLSFELSTAANRVVINCGTTDAARPKWRAVSRQTAAHSTVVVDGRSSARIVDSGLVAKLSGPTLIGGPREVGVDRREHGGVIAVVASHDGYGRSHNLIHERTLRLTASGDRLDGRDLLMPADDLAERTVDYVVRFHLDPAIQPVMLANGVVMLIGAKGEAWEFHAEDIVPRLEDSVYLADPTGAVTTQQIVLAGGVPDMVEQRWTFVRTRSAAAE